jgi:type 1 glutamine amidotransferase
MLIRIVRIALLPAALTALLALVCAAAVAEDAPPPMPLDRAMDALRAYEDGQSRAPLLALERYLGPAAADARLRRDLADRLAAAVADPKTTAAGRRAACRLLPYVADDAHVPVVTALVADAQTAELGRMTLAAIPGDAAGRALRDALGRLRGRPLVGVVNALGERRDAAAAGAIAVLLDDADAAVAGAAAAALGKLGTPDAVAALARAEESAKPPMLAAVRDALLRAAERLARDGDAPAAARIYRRLCDSPPAGRWRLAALAGWAQADPPAALPVLVAALRAEDGELRGTASRLLAAMGGPAVTAALVRALDGAAPADRILIVRTLAATGDAEALFGIEAQTKSDDETVRAAAAEALVALGSAAAVPRLVELAATDAGPAGHAAREGLARMPGDAVEKALITFASHEDQRLRAESVRALGARQASDAEEVLLKASADADANVRRAAYDALAAAGGPVGYARLVAIVACQPPKEMAGEGDAAAAEKAAAVAARRIADDAARVGPVMVALEGASADGRPALVRLLGACGGAAALGAVRGQLASDDAAVRDAAVRTLAAWEDAAAADALLDLAKSAQSATHRTLALRGYLRLMGSAAAAAGAGMIERVRPLITTAETKRLLLAALAQTTGDAALAAARAYADDAEVAAEAAQAVRRIEDAKKGRKPPPPPPAPAHDAARSAARQKAVAEKSPQGWRLVAYVDCGPDAASAAGDGPSLALVAGAAYFWPGSDAAADVHAGTVAFDGREVVFEARGLNPKKAYRAGVAWWDYDHNTRAQSVHAEAGGRSAEILAKTALPSGQAGKSPATHVLDLSRGMTAGGKVRLIIKNEAQPNAVVSELWLLESEADAPPAAPATAPAPATVKRSAKEAPVRVLIVTGREYPGHKWQETAPLLREIIEADPRMAADIVEDAVHLASPGLAAYAAVVLNYMNWESPDPGPAAREGLSRFVEGGKGLVLVHFACGAFQDWPGFVQLAGRVWDPKLRGHDPHGRFRVEILPTPHPATRGLAPFETVDELYTCLAGDVPVTVLAAARSKVDGKDYPMAFVLTPGKGRVFHSVLGHDAAAFAAEGVRQIYRQGTAWAAGLE